MSLEALRGEGFDHDRLKLVVNHATNANSVTDDDLARIRQGLSRMAAAERLGQEAPLPPATTAHGALLNHITGGHIETTDRRGSSFQPMNVNFGLFPPIVTNIRGRERKKLLSQRALADLDAWLGTAAAEAA